MPSVTVNNDLRLQTLHAWLSAVLPEKTFSLLPLAGDASFRRYFRAITAEKSYVVMDAPPAKEDCKPFVAIAAAFSNSVVQLPLLFSANLDDGFLVLSDFGDQQLLPLLQQDTVDELYIAAMNVLLSLQQRDHIPNYVLPIFDDALFWKEFDIFFTWYVQKNLGRIVSAAEEKKLRDAYQLLIDSAASQPTVFVHRDYHSRNIMLCNDASMGILDFQDAVRGPITYDLVSLLRDCYVAWPEDQTERWVSYFFNQLHAENKLTSTDFSTFLRWFDWMGLQRHLKCLGIFSRLCYRDQKSGYLNDIPRVLNYVLSVCDKYPELSVFKEFLQ